MHPVREHYTVAMPWYDEEDFRELWLLAHERAEMLVTYSAWHREAVSVVNHHLAAGRVIQLVTIKPTAFVQWLVAHHLPNTAATRRQYVEELATTKVAA